MNVAARTKELCFASPQDTTDFAERLANQLCAGDVLLLLGDLGAGKTHFARSVIQARLAVAGPVEDVPSPTFTLVQSYDDGQCEIWHADLYRLHGVDDVFELGLIDAFEDAICLIEWPDKIAGFVPNTAISLHFSMTDVPGQRRVQITYSSDRWARVMGQLDG